MKPCETPPLDPAWEQARTFKDICEMAARFVEGKGVGFPGYYAKHPCAETRCIRAQLAAINRAGALTLCSQPGIRNTRREQRAFLVLLGPKRLIEWLTYDLTTTDLLLQQCRPVPARKQAAFATAVTIVGTKLTTVAYPWNDAGRVFPRRTRRLASKLWSACLIDPVWGREAYLFDIVAESLGLFSDERARRVA